MQACAALQALGWLQKATGKSHVITLESTYAAILRLGMYTLSACPAALAPSSRSCESACSINKPRTHLGQRICQQKERPGVYGFIPSLR